MSIVLGAVADDYTGASDLANTLSRNGLRTVQTVGIPADSLDLPDAEAVVISLKIRSIPAGEAVAAARAAEVWLRQRGASHVLYKICSTFDSTDAGNIGPITEALRRDAGGDGVVLVTPAFPQTARTVYLGNLFVGQVPLDESPLKDHPLNPMRDANLVRVLQRQTALKIGLVDLATVSRGPDAVSARLGELAAQGFGAAVIDAVFDQDLETIGAVAFRQPLSTGASGLGLGLARAAVRAGAAAAKKDAVPAASVGGLAAAVAGSCSRATLEQIAIAEQSMPVLRLDPHQLLSDSADTAIETAIDWARARLAAGPVLIASSADPEAVARLQALHGREHSGAAIERATARIAATLVDLGVRRLVIAGGETSGAAVDRLAIPAFLVEEEIAPGVPILRTAGWSRPAMRLALKSGNFGGPDFFARAIGMMA